MVTGQAMGTGITSIIMPCCGQLEYTRLGIPRLLRYSSARVEILCLDIGSLDGTADYLDGVAGAAVVSVSILRAASEKSLAAIVREAVSASRGEFVVWMNNDVLVSEGWLDQFVALARMEARIGMVGPMSNLGPETQKVNNIPYRLGGYRKPLGVGERDSDAGP